MQPRDSERVESKNAELIIINGLFGLFDGLETIYSLPLYLVRHASQ